MVGLLDADFEAARTKVRGDTRSPHPTRYSRNRMPVPLWEARSPFLRCPHPISPPPPLYPRSLDPPPSSSHPPHQVAVTGRSGVGKTALTHHASCSDWAGSFAETLGTCVIQVQAPAAAETTVYDFWEVGGRYAAKFPYAVKAQLQGADVIVHVFSFADRASLLSVSKDVAGLVSADGKSAPVILLGTKRDCVSTCQLSLEEAQHVAAQCNLTLVLLDSPPVEPEDIEGRDNAAAVPLFAALQAACAQPKIAKR